MKKLLALIVLSSLVTSARAELVSYWTFDNTFANTGTQPFSGTVVGDTTFNATAAVSHSTASLSVDGSGDYFVVDGSIGPTSATDFYHDVFVADFAVSLWVKSDAPAANISDDQAYAIDYGETHGDGVGVHFNKNHGSFTNGTVGSYVDSDRHNGPAGTTDWMHVVVTASEGSSGTSDINLYVDGEVVDHSTQSYGGLAKNALRIGSQAKSSDRFWDGLIDDVAVYDQHLNPREVQLLASGEMTPVEVASLTTWDFRREQITSGATAQGASHDGGSLSYRYVAIDGSGDVTGTDISDFDLMGDFSGNTWTVAGSGHPSVRLSDFTAHAGGDEAPVIAWESEMEGRVEYFYSLIENNNSSAASPGVQLFFWDESEGLLSLLEKQDLFPDDPSTVNDHTTLLGEIDVEIGDFLLLAIDDGGNGNGNDRVRVDALIRDITTAPEPSALILCMFGLIGLAFRPRSRKR